MQKLTLAIDANEANIKNRVGSNVYAFEIINQLSKLIKADAKIEAEVLLSQKLVSDMPKETQDWQYQLVRPGKLWTQIAAPIHLYKNQNKYDAYYTPGHYAPRLCPIPYVSSVMDLAFLEFENQFRQNDLLQLKQWTRYSVKNAHKVIAISQFTQQEVIRHYHKSKEDVVVAYPAAGLDQKTQASSQTKDFFNEFGLTDNYFLFIGTLQPRKNLVNLIKAYEIFYSEQNSKEDRDSSSSQKLPKLVIGGKIGWLAEPILAAAAESPVKDEIIFTGFVPNEVKPSLYKNALAAILVGLYEGFGIPALESMLMKTIPIVSNSSSLPEVVGEAGLQVNPHRPEIIAEGLREAYSMPAAEKKSYEQKMQQQAKKFDWKQSAQKILETLRATAETGTN